MLVLSQCVRGPPKLDLFRLESAGRVPTPPLEVRKTSARGTSPRTSGTLSLWGPQPPGRRAYPYPPNLPTARRPDRPRNVPPRAGALGRANEVRPSRPAPRLRLFAAIEAGA